jgi:hypothetical protein
MENLIQYTILLIFSLPSIAAAYFIAIGPIQRLGANIKQKTKKET